MVASDIDLTTIPTQLTERPQWVVWRSEHGTKVPYNARTGGKASTTDPTTWSIYSVALAAAQKGNYNGIGYVFSKDDPFIGIDLDDCIDTQEHLAPWAEHIIKEQHSYSEISPSGRGIKIWVEGQITRSIKALGNKVPLAIKPADMPGGIEIYGEGRYFTMTGWHIEGTPREICNSNGALMALVEALQPPIPVSIPERTYTSRPVGRAYLERWAKYKFEYAIDRVRQAIDGEKHNERYKMAKLLGGLIPHGLATAEDIATLLFDANPPRTEAARSEYKTLLDGARDGSGKALDLPEEPPQPIYDSAGFACCPLHSTRLVLANSGNGYTCHLRDSSTANGWCKFWWDGENYIQPPMIDPETGDDIATEAAFDPTDMLLNAARSDTGNAECLAILNGNDLRYCHTHHKWYAWDGARWAMDMGGAASRAAIAVVRARYRAAESITDFEQRKKFAVWCIGCESASKIDAQLKIGGALLAFSTQIEQYDADPLLAATPGETLDLQAVARQAVRREDYMTMRIGVAYDPAAECPRWRQFLNEIFKSDQELIAYIQRGVGYSLTGDTREQQLFLLHGSGANGKSVFLDILTELSGDYAGNAAFETFDAGKRSESTNDLAALRGKRFVTVIETEEGRRLAEARVKSVTGQDMITCRFLYGEYFSYRPTYKIWLAMNHLPVIRGTDKGIWRRIHLVPFLQSFIGREDKMLRLALRSELPGVLVWALEGLRNWHERGLDPPSAVLRATQQYQAESDQIGRWIIECCVIAETACISVSAAYKSYVAWCEANGEHGESQNKVGRRLAEKGFDRTKMGNTYTWIGFGLHNEDADTR